MKKNKLLTIAIPTYNRCKILNRTIENFIMQITSNKLEDIVEIAVSDNCSNDTTKSVVEKYLQEYPHLLIYNRNKKNDGFDNLRDVAKLGSGKYIWFCGDDDEYFFDSVKNIVNILQKHEVDGVYINQVNGRGYITPVKEDCVVDLKKFFMICGLDPEFLSTVVIKRDKISPKIHITTWYHMAALLNLKDNSKLYICKKPNVYNNVSTPSTWSSWINYVYYRLDMLETISSSSCSNDIKKNLKDTYSSLLKRAIINLQLKNKKNVLRVDWNYVKQRMEKLETKYGYDFSSCYKYINSRPLCVLKHKLTARKIIKNQPGKAPILIDAL